MQRSTYNQADHFYILLQVKLFSRDASRQKVRHSGLILVLADRLSLTGRTKVMLHPWVYTKCGELVYTFMIGEDNSSINRSGELLILGCDECKDSLYRVRRYLDSVASYPDIFNHNHQK